MTADILQPGTVVAERYRIERLVGTGGFARIYKAVELGLQRTVALKVLSTTIDGAASGRSPVRERFMREAQLISRLRDPHTISIYAYDWTREGQLYMALEYIDGVDLKFLLDTDGALAPDRITHIVRQILLGLHEAHALDCLHRDIKPSNIMVFDRLNERDCVKLLDFGIAKAVLTEHQHGRDLTREGGVIGTPGYMSPEQLMGRPLTPASDFFSVGVVVYEMYAGRSPYPSRDATEIYRRMQEFDEDIGALESAPDPLRTSCRRMLHPDVERRARTADERSSILDGREPEVGDLDDTVIIAEPSFSDGRRPRLDTPTFTGGPSEARRPRRAPTLTSFPLGLDPTGHTPSTELTALMSADGSVHADPAAKVSASTPTAEVNPVDERPPTLSADHAAFRPPRTTRNWTLPVLVLVAACVVIGAIAASLTTSDPAPPSGSVAQETGATGATEGGEPATGSGDPTSTPPAASERPNEPVAREESPPDVGNANRIEPEFVEASARARAIVELAGRLAARDAKKIAREADDDQVATATRRPKQRETRGRDSAKKARSGSEKSSDSQDTFQIVPFD